MNKTVYEYLYKFHDPFDREMEFERLSALATELGVRRFKTNWDAYKESQKRKQRNEEPVTNQSDFGEQPYQLVTGEWNASDQGVWRLGQSNTRDYACSHMIMPIELIYGIDTGRYRVKILFRRNSKRPPETIIVDIDKLSSAREIVGALSPYGVSVTSGQRANALVDYIRDVLDINTEIIPLKQSVSRLGWNQNLTGFFPYVGENAVFDSEPFRPIYNCIRQVGSYQDWLAEALDARSYSIAARVVLAASFAAPLIEPLGISPFFVHLWAVTSGTGKTVAQMLGVSVWGNPTLNGPLFPSFKSTSVGFEVMAGFLHSIPVFIDELQLAKDNRGNVKFNVYEMASGGGKLRSNKSLGLDAMRTWANVFITSGESRIVKETDGEGALNRVIDIECKADDKAIRDGHRTANALKKNYGWAGKAFVECLTAEGGLDQARNLYEKFFTVTCQNNVTDKQAMAASALLTADALATEWIFRDGKALTVETLAEYLKSKESVSLMERGYEILCGWVAVNAARFQEPGENDSIDKYGLFRDYQGGKKNVAAIIRHPVFDKVCEDYRLDTEGILSHMKSKGLIVTPQNGRGYTRSTRVNGVSQQCVWLRLPDFVEEDEHSTPPNMGTLKRMIGVKELL